MKVVRLTSENVMRLVAVDITPDGNVITIGGPNGAGKSSVLNSIAMALGGEALVPDEPIRVGEGSAKIVLNLGEFVVTRRFTREKREDGSYGETSSTLIVTNADGTAKYTSPQTLLNKLLGKLTFDPLAFAHADAKPQGEILRRIVNIDLGLFDRQRQAAAAQRAVLKKTHDVKLAQMLALPHHDDAPEAEISMDEVSSEMMRAEAARKHVQDLQRHVDSLQLQKGALQQDLAGHEHSLGDLIRRLKEIESQIRQVNEWTENVKTAIRAAEEEIVTAQAEVEKASGAVPDVTAIKTRIEEIERTNARVRDNHRYAAMAIEVEEISIQVDRQDAAVKAADAGKREALAAAQFPVSGLGLDEIGNVTFNGLPFKQASSAEQIRASVAIGLAMNPTLRVLLIRNGNALDSKSLAAIHQQAVAADAQLWVEWVTESKEGVSVMIEDGTQVM